MPQPRNRNNGIFNLAKSHKPTRVNQQRTTSNQQPNHGDLLCYEQ